MADSPNPTERKYPSGLLKRFRKAILWLYLGSVVVSIPIIYATTYHQALASADQELSLLVDMVTAVRKYISVDVRADLLAPRAGELAPGESEQLLAVRTLRIPVRRLSR